VLYYAEQFDTLLTSSFRLKSFHFDTQKLEIIVHPFHRPATVDSLRVHAIAGMDLNRFSSYSSLESWRFKSFTFNIGWARTQFGQHPIAETRFEITVERRYAFYLWKVFLPLLLMVIVSWSVFWFKPDEASSQVTIAVTTIRTIIAFALAISLTLPRLPYLTLADAFFLTCYVCAFVAMVEVTAVHVAYRTKSKLAMKIQQTARWLVPTAIVVTNAIMITYFLT
jgi:hypothetical protein